MESVLSCQSIFTLWSQSRKKCVWMHACMNACVHAHKHTYTHTWKIEVIENFEEAFNTYHLLSLPPPPFFFSSHLFVHPSSSSLPSGFAWCHRHIFSNLWIKSNTLLYQVLKFCYNTKQQFDNDSKSNSSNNRSLACFILQAAFVS